MKHTPGPWRADDNGDGTHCITAGQGSDVADTRASCDEQANAALIIAAPDLLAVAEHALKIMEEEDNPRFGVQVAMDRIRAVLAKAKRS